MVRRAFIVYVDLDEIPGEFHTDESAQRILSHILSQVIPHYNPLVSLAPEKIQQFVQVFGSHSRECIASDHNHGESCHTSCPTCHGRAFDLNPLTKGEQ